MTHIFVDSHAAVDTLRAWMSQLDEQRAVHGAQAPALNPAAAGRGFVGHGQRLAGTLSELYAQAAWRLDNAEAMVNDALRQVSEVDAGDDANAADLSARQVPGADA